LSSLQILQTPQGWLKTTNAGRVESTGLKLIDFLLFLLAL
jgi:hypothetical protein